MPSEALVVFTGRGPARILQEGGSQAWVLDDRRARACEYIVCCQNRRDVDWAGASEPHGAAFLVGKVGNVVPAWDGAPGRFMVEIREFARIQIPNAWQGWRNPVRYTRLDELGIDPSQLTFESLSAEVKHRPVGQPEESTTRGASVKPLNLSEAKEALSAFYGVPVAGIEITIRG